MEKKNSKPILFCLFTATLIMTICSRSSFLYVYNLWDDANSYFTVGKCMYRGFVPYRDLFDQKGILLYFIYSIASLISATTFRGVYVMEIVAAFFALLAIFNIFRLFIKNEISAYILTPISGAVIYSSWNFYWGGSAEEFLFPFMMWGLYLSVRYFRLKYPEPMDYKTVLVGGILAGCVFHIKFNSLGLFFAWMMMVFFADIIGKRQIAKAFISCFVFLGGMFASTIPWLIYFGVNGAIYDWLYVYIYKNVFEYSKKITFQERLALFYDIMKNHVFNNFTVYVIITVGIVFFLISSIYTVIIKNKEKDSKIFVTISPFELINIGMLFAFLIIVIFIGGVSLPYYSFPINGFVVFGLIPVGYWIAVVITGIGAARIVTVVATALSVVVMLFTSVNVKTMSLKQEDIFLYKFRDYILSTGIENPGIIVEFTFDVGLYTVLDVEPICYYFQTQTLNMEEVLEYQKRYLHSGEADFVVTCDYEAEGTGDNYHLVMEEDIDIYRFKHTYYLYERDH